MIGVKLTDREVGTTWTVVGSHGPLWIISPTEFGSPEYVTTAAIRDRFSASAEAPEQPSEADGWEAIGQANQRAAEALAQGATPASRPTPEERFAVTSQDAANRLGHGKR